MSGQVRTDGLAFQRSTLQQPGGLAESLQVQWLYPKKLRVRANRPQSDLGLRAENDKTGSAGGVAHVSPGAGGIIGSRD
jgi:hypothetical protein